MQFPKIETRIPAAAPQQPQQGKFEPQSIEQAQLEKLIAETQQLRRDVKYYSGHQTGLLAIIAACTLGTMGTILGGGGGSVAGLFALMFLIYGAVTFIWGE